MTYLKRFAYFILTGLFVAFTVSFVVSFITRFFGINLAAGGYAGLFVLCLVYGMVGSFISLQLSRWMAKKFHGVEVIDPQTTNPTARKLLDTVYRLARNAGLDTMPEVGIYESPDVNAFATGPSKARSLVAVSSGLLNTMSEGEIEGVLAHELAHITNGDMVTLTLIQGVVNAFAMFFAHIITTIIMNSFRGERDDRRSGFGDFMLRNFIYHIVAIVFTVFGSIIVNYFSRQREFRADAGGARFASPEKMAAALQRLQLISGRPAVANTDQSQGRDDLAVMKISGKTSGMTRLFMTHPPLEERLAALRNRTYMQT